MKKQLPNRNSNTTTVKMFSKIVLILFVVFLNLQMKSQGTWSTMNGTNPNGGTAITLSDGSIIVKTEAGGGDGIGNIWDKITPNATGSYVGGTWSSLPPMASTRLYISSQMLKDGRVYTIGGEYGSGYGNKAGDVYNPITNTWTQTPLPGGTVSDANSEILDDGRVLQAEVCCGLTAIIIYTPSTNTYGPGPACLGIHNESAWAKLPDNSVLFVNRLSTSSERYLPATNQWTLDATTPVPLYDGFGDETGSALLLPDGRVWFAGSTGKTAYYTPSGTSAPGTWTAGPSFPNNYGTPDAGSAIMPNGKILCVGSPSPTSGNVFKSPSQFFEFDYLTNTFTPLTLPCNNSYTNVPCYYFNFMNMPDGKVLVSRQDTNQYFVYSPTGAPQAAWQPTVGTITQNGCNTFTMTGKLFNGISEGSSYGDDWQNATNYPLVRLTSTANVVYFARTSNWNSTGVARGNKADTCNFTTPLTLPIGTYSLQVIANGIASQPILFTPYPTLNSSLLPPSVCSNALFTYTPTSASGTATFSWTRPAVVGISNAAVTIAQPGNVSENLGNTTALPVNVIYSYTTSANNCSTTQQVTLAVNPTPTVSVSPSATVCSGSNVNLVASGAVSYTWSNSSNGATITVNPTSNTTYTVTGSNSYGCTNSQQTSISVNPSPNITISTLSQTICAGESTILNANGGVSYVWYDNTTGTSINANPTSSAWYWVTGTNAQGCSSTASLQVIVDPCVGIKEIGNDFSKSVDIYPNPAHESVTVAFNAKASGKYTVKIMDMTGKLVKEESLMAIKGDNTHEMSLNGIAKGIYTIVLEKENSTAKTKLSIK